MSARNGIDFIPIWFAIKSKNTPLELLQTAIRTLMVTLYIIYFYSLLVGFTSPVFMKTQTAYEEGASYSSISVIN